MNDIETPTLDSVFEDALKLSEEDRELLTIRLAIHMDDSRDPDYEQEWAEEIERRIRAIESGEEELFDIEEVERFVWGDETSKE